jgi:hypothetical protein
MVADNMKLDPRDSEILQDLGRRRAIGHNATQPMQGEAFLLWRLTETLVFVGRGPVKIPSAINQSAKENLCSQKHERVSDNR